MKHNKPIQTTDDEGNIRWRLNGNGPLHREDGPAVIYRNGVHAWWKYNTLHREDGPAIYDPLNQKIGEEWYVSGKRYHTSNLKDWPTALYLAYIKTLKNKKRDPQ